jgi:ATP-dependent DNA helicase DinG
LLRDAARVAGPETSATAGIAEAMANLDHCATEFWRQVPRSDQPARLKVAFQGEARLRLQRLLGAVGHLADRWAPHQAESVDSEAIQRRVEQLGEDLTGLLRDPAPGEVRWVDTRGRTVSLQTVPVHAAPALEQHLFRQGVAVVLTSATLSLDGSFDYLRERLGIPPAAAELVLDSPFDHACQGLLYIPRDLPDPREPGFAQAAAAQIQGLLAITRGRAFCLFTSHRALRQAAETLQEALPYPLLIQGEAPREVLLERFRREAGAVLLGAQSFWEGVDVPGDALSAVIIDKLPFASPSEPLTEARIEQLNAQGRSAFFSYQVPAAAMSLRQGAGRLLRRGTDRGIVAVLDTRLLTRAYGRYLRTCLPPFPMTRELSDVRAFFDHSSVS